MEQDYMLNIIDENGNPAEIEVLDIFSVEAYPGKEYILYTKGEVEGDMEKTYVSILQETDTEANLLTIEDETEFSIVQDCINYNFSEEADQFEETEEGEA